MVHGTVATIRQAFLFLELSITASASPGHNPGGELRLVSHELVVITEVPHKIEGFVIRRGVPQLPINFVILVLENELS